MNEHAALEQLNLDYIRSVQESDARWFDTDVWMRRDARWLCVSAHVTRG